MKSIKEELFENHDVTSVSRGYKYVNGKKTSIECIVVGVKKKKPGALTKKDRLVPTKIQGLPTDVQERDIKALGLTKHMRPCPPGFSIGHTSITAGTLGAWVKRGSGDEYHVLSNNHVLANSNDAQPNDVIIQPGKADGGFSGTDRFALLEDFAVIKWDGNSDGKKKAAKFLWSVWKWPANMVAKMVGCPYRLQVHSPHAIEQPNPNLIDAAVAIPVTQGNVRLGYLFDIGEAKGMKDLQLGDQVQKTGRTTEHTIGTVEGVDAMTLVQYGPGKLAKFDDQLEIRNESEFSAGGDSGSAILTMDGYIGGLLFAGGSGVTIANRISNVISILGIRL